MHCDFRSRTLLAGRRARLLTREIERRETATGSSGHVQEARSRTIRQPPQGVVRQSMLMHVCRDRTVRRQHICGLKVRFLSGLPPLTSFALVAHPPHSANGFALRACHRARFRRGSRLSLEGVIAHFDKNPATRDKRGSRALRTVLDSIPRRAYTFRLPGSDSRQAHLRRRDPWARNDLLEGNS
jgi:hypothetical protein